MTEIETQARSILNSLIEIPFFACIPITRSFETLTTKPGIYAVRHISDGLLYVGKSQDIKERFRGGHKALIWSWLADYNHRDVRVAACPIEFRLWKAVSSELERIILQITEPPFNARIPTRE